MSIHFGSYHNEDTGTTTPLYLHSPTDIDREVDLRVRLSRADDEISRHESKRVEWHAALSDSLTVGES